MKERKLQRRLSVQLVGLLTVALLPLGSIAVFQTQQVANEADLAAGLAVLGLTERAARAEQLLIERAVGTARFFSKIAAEFALRPETCAPILSRFITSNPEYSFIGLQPKEGPVLCASAPVTPEFRTIPNLAEKLESPQAEITLAANSTGIGASSFVVSEPYEVDGAIAGFVSVFIPHNILPDTTERLENLGLVELITFNDNGGILTARSSIDAAKGELPSGRDLAMMTLAATQTLKTKNRNGIVRRYSTVPIDGSPATVLAVWRVDEAILGREGNVIPSSVFPVLMWMASMGVAMLAMHTLVLRHLTRLRRRMDAFSDTRQISDPIGLSKLAPLEIEELEKNFDRMSEEVLRDEARLEDSLREKGVLVKEIHHRVKNNLQLISSIMNMQIRNAEHDETRTKLRQVQERVLSLATIHRDLYQSQDQGRVQVGNLVSEIVEKSVELAVADGTDLHVDRDIDPVLLYPDQAVPLSLLVSEATTNALKYLGTVDGSKRTLKVSLKQTQENCCLTVANTVGAPTGEVAESTGLGSKLMSAFAQQLGGQIEVSHSDTWYELSLTFAQQEFEPEARDY